MQSKFIAAPVLASLFALTLASSSCGGSTDDTPGTSTGGSGGGACPNLAGTWTVAKHCQSALVGSAVTITQNGCSFKDETYGFTGTLDGKGTLTASGGGVSATCTGSATAKAITENCTVSGQLCTVSLTR
jgi:hypothetical protein